MLMRFFRDLRWKLADRFEPLNSKSMYYNPKPEPSAPPSLAMGWNGLLLAMFSMVLIGIGALAVIGGAMVLWAIFTA